MRVILNLDTGEDYINPGMSVGMGFSEEMIEKENKSKQKVYKKNK